MIFSYNQSLPTGRLLYFGDTGPPSVAGDGNFYVAGDFCFVYGAGSGSPVLWECTAGGAPGTWESVAGGGSAELVGPLSATSTSQAFPSRGGKMQIAGVTAVASAKGGAGATVTVEALTGTTAPGGGTAQLTTPLVIDASYTNNTTLTGVVVASPAILNSANGDRVGIVLAGTLTALANLYLMISFKRTGN